MQALVLDRFEGDEFDHFDWRLRTHRRMHRRENMELEIQRQARQRDEEQSLVLRRMLLEQLSVTLSSTTGEGGSCSSGSGLGLGDMTAEEVEARVERCAVAYAECKHLKAEIRRVEQVRLALLDYDPTRALPHPRARVRGDRPWDRGVFLDGAFGMQPAYFENVRRRLAAVAA